MSKPCPAHGPPGEAENCSKCINEGKNIIFHVGRAQSANEAMNKAEAWLHNK